MLAAEAIAAACEVDQADKDKFDQRGLKPEEVDAIDLAISARRSCQPNFDMPDAMTQNRRLETLAALKAVKHTYLPRHPSNDLHAAAVIIEQIAESIPV